MTKQAKSTFAREESFLITPKKGGDFQVALFYPNSYYLAMSNLGFQTVYRLLNQIPGVLCERAFLPESPEQKVFTLESKRPLSAFHLVAVSFSYEMDISNFLKAVFEAKLALLSKERKELYPLIMAGGALTFLNPEPIAEMVDFFLLGDAEEAVEELFKVLKVKTHDKASLLKEIAKLPGFYVPSFYQPVYQADGRLEQVKALPGVPFPLEPVKSSREALPAFSGVITPQTEFSSTFLVEVSRGCPHSCNFCLLGWGYKPYREVCPEKILALLKKAQDYTSCLGLIASDLLNYSGLKVLKRELESRGFKLGFSSFRADKLSREFLELLAFLKVKSLTLAPEAGSEKLRALIGKPILDQKLLEATESASRLGIKNLRLYFMLGLPGECPEDIKAIITLVKTLRKIQLKAGRGGGGGAKLSLSINPFVPKAFTPFMWAEQEPAELIKPKFARIRKELAFDPGITLRGESPQQAIIQGILARGDRRLTRVLLTLAPSGKWQGFCALLKKEGLETGFYTRQREKTELFPFEHLRKKLAKERLYALYLKAKQRKCS